ncbi:MAG: NAD(P)H-binding protein [Vicinamibacterales bacterium]
MATETNERLLVTGASGHLGRRVVDLLIEHGARDVIAVTRTPEALGDVASRGVDVRRADFDDPSSLPAAFAGATRVLLVSTSDIATPGRRLRQQRAAVTAAAEAGVRHIVYTSAPAPHPTPSDSLINDHFWTEAAIVATGLEWTILRNNLYTDFLLQGLPQAVATGQLVTAAGTGRRGYVTRDDCATAAEAALRSARGRQILDVTGPDALTQAEVAALVGDLTGRSIDVVRLDGAALLARLKAAVPLPYAEALVYFDMRAAEGHHAMVTSAVRDLTGRAPMSVPAFLKAHLTALTPTTTPGA